MHVEVLDLIFFSLGYIILLYRIVCLLFTFACVTLPFYWLFFDIVCLCVCITSSSLFFLQWLRFPQSCKIPLCLLLFFQRLSPLTHSLLLFWELRSSVRIHGEEEDADAGGIFCLCDYYVIMEIMALLCRVEIRKF